MSDTTDSDHTYLTVFRYPAGDWEECRGTRVLGVSSTWGNAVAMAADDLEEVQVVGTEGTYLVACYAMNTTRASEIWVTEETNCHRITNEAFWTRMMPEEHPDF